MLEDELRSTIEYYGLRDFNMTMMQNIWPSQYKNGSITRLSIC